MINHRLHRLKKQITQIVIFSLLCLIFPALCFAQSISSTELINSAKEYDGEVVVYEGEVIGDIMMRGDYTWINVNDGENAIGVWLESSLAQDIGHAGSYKSRGDVIEVKGIFQRACSQHGGDLDIHAKTIKEKSRGREIQEQLNLGKKNQAIILLGMLFGVWILTRLKGK